MARTSKRGPVGLIRKGTFGLALALPFVSCPMYSEASNIEIINSQNQLGVANSRLSNDFQHKTISDNQQSPDLEINKIANNSTEKTQEKLFLIAEVIIEGIDGHPDQKRLQYAAYDAMSIRPGSKVSRKDVQRDLEAIYATGWFSGATIDSQETPLGIGLIVKVQPNPLLKRVDILPKGSKLELAVIDQIFKRDYGKTLNLNILQLRIKELKNWYLDEGYSLSRISGPNRISPEGIIELNVNEGAVEGFEIIFINEDGETVNENGKEVKGKTKIWVIERELSLKPGDVFNRNKLEEDIKRLYGLGLFTDVKVTLKPAPGKPGHVFIVLGITEQRTGTLTGGIGYSGAQGVFGQGGLQESNLLGRSWKTSFNMSYGEYGGLINLSLRDPWIKGDKYRSSFRGSIFVARDVPQEFRSEKDGNIKGISERYEPSASYSTAYQIDSTTPTGSSYTSVDLAKAADNTVSWFDYEGDSIVLQRSGGSFSFGRPLNGGDPFKRAKWSVLLGMNFQKIKAIDYAGNKRPYGVVDKDISTSKSAPKDSVICVAFNCADENTLVSFRAATSYNNVNDSRNPTSGDFLSFSTEQYVSLGNNSPTFNRARVGYSYFIPVNWLKLHKGCRPKDGEKRNCPQTIAFQAKTGSIVGDLPPYEAFCVGGTSSVRGFASCDLAVGRSFGEASVEYRYPIWRIVSGALFVDAGTDFGSQSSVPGKPGVILDKPGHGYSLGTSFVVNTPVGPLRFDVASKELGEEWRYNLGVGWKF
ncbi:BamA/TamA family outer membrane protein [Prochlorococcus sp. MIT 1223]|uniref:BamA/TamA family outer membrane protein n=1 Tax=Prochlorococcus sp. MIT 1223 TaxID=3096217 RepID=UPI002A750A37|nr:BamA/TamA family outer membrane protein [Prochlorococcus sp. MIT 1223]